MVKISVLTDLIFELNALIDEGLSIPLKEVKNLCKEKRIIEELERKFPFKETGLNLSLLKCGTREELDEIFYDMAITVNERRAFRVENNGLCLLVAYAQKQIHQELVKYYRVKIL
jgi:hypothetical protein